MTHVSVRALAALRGEHHSMFPTQIGPACEGSATGDILYETADKRPIPYALMTSEVTAWRNKGTTLPLPTCPNCLRFVLEALIELAGKQRGKAITEQEIAEVTAKLKANAL